MSDLENTSPPLSSPDKVNLLDLAAAAVACTITASRSIRSIARQGDQPDSEGKEAVSTTTSASASSNSSMNMNTRLKEDGSFVTDADYCAQGIIVQALYAVSTQITIVGEESVEEMAQHMNKYPVVQQTDFSDEEILQRTRKELRLRLHMQQAETETEADSSTSIHTVSTAHLPLTTIADSPQTATTSSPQAPEPREFPSSYDDDPADCFVDASRVSVFVDPLDGTKSYAHGDYDAVSILIAILVDHQPVFGVISKPFGYQNAPFVTNILSCKSAAIYGGPLLKGVYVAGGIPIRPAPLAKNIAGAPKIAVDLLPRAVISGSRSKGVVHDFCLHLGEQGILHPEPMLISGAGEKSLRLILQQDNEALWFFPKAGTSRWDVAAPDALLRALGGKLTDKYGRDMDYSSNCTTTKDAAENVDGVIACIDAILHAECVRLFAEGNWEKSM